MKLTLWILGLLLLGDLLFISYFHVFRRGYYFPDRYEDAYLATFYAVLLGLPVLIAFLIIMGRFLRRRDSRLPQP